MTTTHKPSKIGSGKYEYRGYIIRKQRHYTGRGFVYYWTVTIPGYKNDRFETRHEAMDTIDRLTNEGGQTMTTATRTATYTTESGNTVELHITAERGTYNDEGTTDGVARYSIERAHIKDSIELVVNGEIKLKTAYQVYDITDNPAAAKLREAGYVAALFSDGRPVVGFTAAQHEAVKAAYEAAIAEAAHDADYTAYVHKVAKTGDEAAEYERKHDEIERVRAEGR